MTRFEKWTLRIEAIGVLMVVGTLWYMAEGLKRQTDSFKLQSKVEERTLEWSRLGVLLDYHKKYNEEYVKAFGDVEVVAQWKEKNLMQPIEHFFETDTTGRVETSVMQVLNFFESLGLAVTSDYTDGREACGVFRTITDRYYTTLSDWLYRKRRGGHGWDETSYVLLDSLQSRWQAGCG